MTRICSSLGGQSELLASDSDSEEEEISMNFVDMWKARSTPPIKLPDWDPNKSIEEHRRRVRESLERTESASSASSEQWILNYPFPDSPQSRVPPPNSEGPGSTQNSAAGMTRQDSTNSRIGENCEEDKRILDELLEKERTAQSKSSSSGGGVVKERKVGQKNVKLGSTNSICDSSIMSDFLSSIMAEIKIEPGSPPESSGMRKSKDDLVKNKKPNSHILRSQSMKVSSRPHRTRIPSGESAKLDCGALGIPKSNIHASKTATAAKNIDAGRTKAQVGRHPAVTTQGNDTKKKGFTFTKVSLMPKALSRTAKAIVDSPNVNQSGSGGQSGNSIEKLVGKTKKLNLKYGKGKVKGGESNSKVKTKDSDSNSRDVITNKKDSNSKSKSRIPQLIRQGLKASPVKSESNKKKNSPNKETASKAHAPSTSLNSNGKWKEGQSQTNLDPSAFKEVLPLDKTPSFVVDNVPFIDDSLTSPSKDTSQHCIPSTHKYATPGDQVMQGKVCWGQSPKLSPQLLQRLRASGIELANSSGSDNDSVFLPDDPSSCAASALPSKFHIVANSKLRNERTDIGCGSELHLDEKEIEDIKNGLLVSDADALSVGSWSTKSSEFGIKNLFLFSNGDFCNGGSTPSHRSLSRGSLGRGSEAPSVSSNPEDNGDGERPEDTEGEEGQAKQYNVPLVSSDLMEDFEAEDLCEEEEGMSSDREKEAQLTENERANLLDSLFESDDSEECELDGFLDESSESLLDSHPDEKEFMKLLGDKGLKRQVVRQSVYCRVSLLQMDIFSLYNRFGDPEKEALACFDFLEEMYFSNAGETHFTDDHPLSLISPQNGISGGMKDQIGGSSGIKECLDGGLLQAGDAKSALFGEDPTDLSHDGDAFHTKNKTRSMRENSEPSSGEFSEHFDAESYGNRHSNKVFDGCYAIGDFCDHLGNRSNLCSSVSSSSSASLSSHE